MMWQQGQQVEIEITDLTDDGNGVGRYQDRVVFVPDAVPGDRLRVRLVRVKSKYAEGKVQDILEASPYRVSPRCIVADKCGGCQWQHIDYEFQLQAKRDLVVKALERIGGFIEPPVEPVLAGESPLGYRNKVTYPLGRSATGQVQAGYFQKHSHRLVNLNQCPVQDQRLNPLLANIKQDIQKRGWSIYDEPQHRGKLRHLSLRIGQRTGEMLLTLIATQGSLPGLQEQAETWLEQYPSLKGVCLNINADQTNAIFGQETRCLAGQPYLKEEFGGLSFLLRPDTFFQINTEVAEALLQIMLQDLNLQGTERIVDAYCGIGTFTLPLAKDLLQKQAGSKPSLQSPQVIGLEVQEMAIEQARQNAILNQIDTVEFKLGTVQKLLPQLGYKPDIVLLDPPRKGCDRRVLETLLDLQPQRLIYISCKPATLARDLKVLCETGVYELIRVQPADFFPQTSHVECAAFLSRSSQQ
ncbi:23S rRNA (uracil(1939)-C(5))-methyltransferase RlmD [Planktothrix sp. FACHB-1365]|uniref:23S rRNA (uracil(1939)-C(5))-methyltransferase RlmD n=1 Tax=Planktothrix sp. FACHB-1365 TaxID=2692855 RepID=UPI00168964F0|nr:23S rRNA (uracil(1939)-C(5))-methyltransferase RlmD [Planktothrix sp. FACHB-1365]MBD2485462.1 23S rRNA (uracil(1939)-C(5))-methyltransferase RlmD [Planktothrix sp. FACHB-1365]